MIGRLFRQGMPKSRRTLLPIAELDRSQRRENEAAIRALCQNAYLGDGWGLCRVLGRYKLFVDTRDKGLSSHLMLDGFWEMWLTELFAERIRRGMTVIDVGANLGYFTVLMADLVGEAGHVHAFEPNPPIAERLRQSCYVNGYFYNVTVHEQALDDTDGKVLNLAVPAGEPKNAHTLPENIVPEGIEIRPMVARRLDSYPELLDADLIKIDVEGAEEGVWRGMAGIFARQRRLTIVLEFAAMRYADPGAFLDRITALGFRLSLIDLKRGVRSCTRAQILAAPAQIDQMLLLER